ncbi:hypothetical protein ERJ75_000390100 [Trypanosoma vivax]|nr:hypothetical protein ERJ75_000390100 [Trypanosoma vivax]
MPPVGGIFLITPPPVDEEAWVERLRAKGVDIQTSDLRFEKIRQYRDAVLQIGAAEMNAHRDVHVIDMYRVILGPEADTMEYSRGAWCDNFYDGLHFNEKGATVLFSALADAIKRSSKAQHIIPENVPYALPHYETFAPL